MAQIGPPVVVFRGVCKILVLILVRDKKLSRNLREVVSIQRAECFHLHNQARSESRREKGHPMRVAFRQLGRQAQDLASQIDHIAAALKVDRGLTVIEEVCFLNEGLRKYVKPKYSE